MRPPCHVSARLGGLVHNLHVWHAGAVTHCQTIGGLNSSRKARALQALTSLALTLALLHVPVLHADTGVQQAYLQLVDELNALVPAAIASHERIDPDIVTAHVDRFVSAYIPPEGIASLDDESAHLLFRAALGSTLFAPDQVPTVLVPLAKRASASKPGTPPPQPGFPTTPPLEDAYQRLINARDFDRAREFARDNAIQPVPWATSLDAVHRHESGTASFLRFRDEDGMTRAERVAVDVSTGAWLIVEAHPGCAFSRRAMAYFSGNAPLVDDLPQGNILWVVPQDRSEAVPSILEWNASNPDTELVLAYRNRDWPTEISFLEYPVFNLFHDGELVTKVTGWPNDEQIEEIRSGMRMIDRAQ